MPDPDGVPGDVLEGLFGDPEADVSAAPFGDCCEPSISFSRNSTSSSVPSTSSTVSPSPFSARSFRSQMP